MLDAVVQVTTLWCVRVCVCVCVLCVCVCVECVCGVGVWYVCGVCMRWGGLAVVTLKDLRCQASLAIMLTA